MERNHQPRESNQRQDNKHSCQFVEGFLMKGGFWVLSPHDVRLSRPLSLFLHPSFKSLSSATRKLRFLAFRNSS
jgi:hypothetical protein